MRILLAVHQFFPDFSAGTEVVTANVALELVRRGHQVQIFTGHPGTAAPCPDEQRFDHYEYQGLRVDRFVHAFVPMGGQANVIELQHDNQLVKQHFGQVLDDFRPDVTHAFNLARLSASPVDACHERKIPVFFTATDYWLICPVSQLLLPGNRLCPGPAANSANCVRHLAVASRSTLMRRLIYRLPDSLIGGAIKLMHSGLFPATPLGATVRALQQRPVHLRRCVQMLRRIIVPSVIMQQTLMRNGIDREKMVLLPNGIHSDHIPRLADKGAHPALRVGSVGTLAEHKGPHVLLDAMRHVDRDAPIELSIHGPPGASPEYVQGLRQRAAGLSQVRLAGTFPRESIGQILGQMDVLVVPSLWYENAPLVMYEAGAGGCVIVASDLPGMAELVEPGVNGLLVPPGDARRLARTLTKSARDRRMVAQLATGSRLPMTVEAHVDELEGLYRRG